MLPAILAVAAVAMATGLVGCSGESSEDVRGRGAPDSGESHPKIPPVQVSFEADSHENHVHEEYQSREILYYAQNDKYCDSRLRLRLEVPSVNFFPMVFVKDSPDFAHLLTGYDSGKTLDIGSADGRPAVSVSSNIFSSNEVGVFYFDYTPAADSLFDGVWWSVMFYVVATDGYSGYGEAAQWSYENAQPSSHCN